jgi:AraC-like DNA-binding protein
MSMVFEESPTLAHLGIRWSERVQVRTRTREIRDTVAFSMDSAMPTDLVVDTRSSHPNHAAFLFVATEGEHSSSATGSYVLQAPHGAVTRLRYRSPWAATGVLIHRSPLNSFIQHLPDNSVVYRSAHHLERSMVAFIGGILHAGTAPSSLEEYAIAQLLTEMGVAVLLDRNGLPPVNSRESVRQAALAFIVHQSSNPDLTPIDVARHVRVSLRALQAVFAEQGTSPAAEIRRQRARRAHSWLTDSRYATLSVDQVARRAGFGTSMSLRRALRDEYGTTPGSLRRH